MDFDIYISQILNTYKSAIKVRIYMIIGFVLAGTLIIAFNIFGEKFLPNQLGLVIDISGMVITSIGAFPFKEIVDKRSKIKHLSLLSSQYQKSYIGDKKRIENIIWKLIEKDTVN